MTHFAAGRGRLLVAVFVAILGADRLTKVLAERWLSMGDPVSVIPGLLQFSLVHNTGMAFGLLNDVAFAGKVWILTAVSGALLAAIVWFTVRAGPLSTATALGITAMLAGAVGNIADRLLHGHVVDFLDAYLGTAHWPTFNIADAAICAGVGLLLLESVRDLRRAPAGDTPATG